MPASSRPLPVVPTPATRTLDGSSSFGIGTDFRKLKYPLVWYDVLQVMDALGRFPFLHADPRFREMIETMTWQADDQGRYTASSMYRAWKRWSFADKKTPSPWLTFLVLRSSGRIRKGLPDSPGKLAISPDS